MSRFASFSSKNASVRARLKAQLYHARKRRIARQTVVVPREPGDALLLENGDYLLLENGDKLLLE